MCVQSQNSLFMEKFIANSALAPTSKVSSISISDVNGEFPFVDVHYLISIYAKENLFSHCCA
jgi:hypothetical protein